MFTEAIQDGAADLALLRLPDIDRVLIGRFFFPEQKIDAAEGEFISVRVIRYASPFQLSSVARTAPSKFSSSSRN